MALQSNDINALIAEIDDEIRDLEMNAELAMLDDIFGADELSENLKTPTTSDVEEEEVSGHQSDTIISDEDSHDLQSSVLGAEIPHADSNIDEMISPNMTAFEKTTESFTPSEMSEMDTPSATDMEEDLDDFGLYKLDSDDFNNQSEELETDGIIRGGEQLDLPKSEVIDEIGHVPLADDTFKDGEATTEPPELCYEQVELEDEEGTRVRVSARDFGVSHSSNSETTTPLESLPSIDEPDTWMENALDEPDDYLTLLPKKDVQEKGLFNAEGLERLPNVEVNSKISSQDSPILQSSDQTSSTGLQLQPPITVDSENVLTVTKSTENATASQKKSAEMSEDIEKTDNRHGSQNNKEDSEVSYNASVTVKKLVLLINASWNASLTINEPELYSRLSQMIDLKRSHGFELACRNKRRKLNYPLVCYDSVKRFVTTESERDLDSDMQQKEAKSAVDQAASVVAVSFRSFRSRTPKYGNATKKPAVETFEISILPSEIPRFGRSLTLSHGISPQMGANSTDKIHWSLARTPASSAPTTAEETYEDLVPIQAIDANTIEDNISTENDVDVPPAVLVFISRVVVVALYVYIMYCP